ncbi:MAG: DUF885 domain-containing protein, partial [Pseudomonadota bacterium]
MIRAATAIASILLLSACEVTDQGRAAAPADPAPAPAAVTPIVEAEKSETEALNEWFEAQFQAMLERSPMTQTFLGIKTDYGQWDDASDANAIREMELQRAAVAEMRETFDYDKLDDQGKLSWRLAEYELELEEADFPFRHHRYSFTQMRGQHAGIPAFMINQHRITSVSDAEAYIERLKGVEPFLAQHVENAARSSALGVRPPLFAFDYVISDATNVITGAPFPGEGDEASPLMGDFSGKLAALVEKGELSEEDADVLKAEAADALLTQTGPAYQRLIEFVTAEKALADTDDGVWKLPDGEAYYAMKLQEMTTTDMTADEVHDLGLSEVARIHDEMRA